jgi:hypothetical protein
MMIIICIWIYFKGESTNPWTKMARTNSEFLDQVELFAFSVFTAL